MLIKLLFSVKLSLLEVLAAAVAAVAAVVVVAPPFFGDDAPPALFPPRLGEVTLDVGGCSYIDICDVLKDVNTQNLY